MSSWIQIRGDSMQPFLAPGDEVRIDWFDAYRPAHGEIVVGKAPAPDTEWIIHRVVDTRAGGFRTKGDSAFVPDELSLEAVFGRAVELRKRESPHRAIPLRVSRLDRAIALLSLRTHTTGPVRSRLIRRAVRLLGALRRRLL